MGLTYNIAKFLTNKYGDEIIEAIEYVRRNESKKNELNMNEEKLYEEIWQWIRELKIKYKHDEIVRIKATCWSFADRFQEYEPKEISTYLKKLVDSKRIKTNIFEDGVYPFDAYILPSNF